MLMWLLELIDAGATAPPEPAKADGPSDTELIEWVEENRMQVVPTSIGLWDVYFPDNLVTENHPDWRSAVRAAMAKGA